MSIAGPSGASGGETTQSADFGSGLILVLKSHAQGRYLPLSRGPDRDETSMALVNERLGQPQRTGNSRPQTCHNSTSAKAAGRPGCANDEQATHTRGGVVPR